MERLEWDIVARQGLTLSSRRDASSATLRDHAYGVESAPMLAAPIPIVDID